MTNRLRKTSKTEDGWVLIVAIVVMALMISVGLGVFKLVDGQQALSGLERVRESSFNLAEGALAAQTVTLENNWPTKPPCSPVARNCGFGSFTTATATGSPCTFASGSLTGASIQCPAQAVITKSFNNVDAALGSTQW